MGTEFFCFRLVGVIGVGGTGVGEMVPPRMGIGFSAQCNKVSIELASRIISRIPMSFHLPPPFWQAYKQRRERSFVRLSGGLHSVAVRSSLHCYFRKSSIEGLIVFRKFRKKFGWQRKVKCV